MRGFSKLRFKKVVAAAAVVVLGAAAAFAAGCSNGDDDATTTGGTGGGGNGNGNDKIAEVRFNAVDFAYQNVPSSIESGLVRFTMSNTGQEPHQAQVGRLNDGVTMAQFQSSMAGGNPEAALALISLHGGPNVVSGGESQEVVDDLPPGTYVLLCFVAGDDEVPHVAKGMLANFTVTPGSGSPASPPESDAQVTTADFNFLGLDTLRAGESTIEVTNAGPQPHEVTILKLENGYTIDQLKAEFTATMPDTSGPAPSEPPPVTEAGGIGAIDRGTKGYMTVDLSAGEYALLCFVPDPATGAPHAALGMVKGLTVR